MSIDAMAYAKTLPVTDPTSRLLMISIAENTFNDSFRCKVGIMVLAEDVCVHERTIMRRLKELEEGGIIRRHQRHERNGRKPDAIEIVGFEPWLLANRPHRARRSAGSGGGSGGGDAGGSQPDNLSGCGERANEPPPDSGLDDATCVSSQPDNLATGQVGNRAAGVRLPTGQQVSGCNKESRTRDLPVLSPPTPAGGREGECEDQDQDQDQEDRDPAPAHHPIVDELIAEGQPEHVAVELIGWLLRDLQPWKHVADPLATARQLCMDLAGTRVAVIEAARGALRKGARYRLPPPADILAAVEAADRAHDAALGQLRQAEAESARRAAADPTLGMRTAALRAALAARLGTTVMQSWFATLAAESLQGGRLTVSVGPKFVREWVASNYEQAIVEAACAALGPVQRVDIVLTPQRSAPGAGAAA